MNEAMDVSKSCICRLQTVVDSFTPCGLFLASFQCSWSECSDPMEVCPVHVPEEMLSFNQSIPTFTTMLKGRSTSWMPKVHLQHS